MMCDLLSDKLFNSQSFNEKVQEEISSRISLNSILSSVKLYF